MITRRRYIAIVIMMIALFILFQGPRIVQEHFNDYKYNSHYSLRMLTREDIWDGSETASEEVILVGTSEELEQYLSEWAFYSKRRLVQCVTLEEAVDLANETTRCVVIEPEIWEEYRFYTNVAALLDEGISILCSDIPETEVFEEDYLARDLLGISEVKMDEVKTDGLRLFDGFLLGGERIFLPETENDEKRQDLDLTMPWYRTGAGVETFMMGIFQDDMYEGEELENEELPPVIWSCGHGAAKVYAILGDYMQDRMIAVGLMSAVMSDLSEIDLYPIVNSQQLQILNFPSLANENKEVLQEIYSRTQNQFEQNIVYPGLKADTDRNGFSLTAYIMPQYDYSDDNEPVDNELIWYLSQLNEQEAELGYSLVHNDTVTLSDKLTRDLKVLDDDAADYKIAAIYTTADEAEHCLEQLPERLKESVNTVCTENLAERGIVDYLTDEVTVQQSTAAVNSYTYRNDLQMMAVETALGYASISIDMKRILWPEDEADQWQNASRSIFSVVDTYWKNFAMLDKTTASETDQHLRNLLSASYSYTKEGNVIHLSSDHYVDEMSFILRTHNQKVTGVSNGTFKWIEQDAYLITVNQSAADITLEEDINKER